MWNPLDSSSSPQKHTSTTCLSSSISYHRCCRLSSFSNHSSLSRPSSLQFFRSALCLLLPLNDNILRILPRMTLDWFTVHGWDRSLMSSLGCWLRFWCHWNLKSLWKWAFAFFSCLFFFVVFIFNKFLRFCLVKFFLRKLFWIHSWSLLRWEMVEGLTPLFTRNYCIVL